jgi:hypothetical protein
MEIDPETPTGQVREVDRERLEIKPRDERNAGDR